MISGISFQWAGLGWAGLGWAGLGCVTCVDSRPEQPHAEDMWGLGLGRLGPAPHYDSCHYARVSALSYVVQCHLASPGSGTRQQVTCEWYFVLLEGAHGDTATPVRVSMPVWSRQE